MKKLKKQTPISGASTEPSPLYRLELKDYEQEMLEGVKQDREERKIYARRVFVLTSAWLLAIVILLVLQGLKRVWLGFELSEGVILALIGGTTVNVLGFFYFVLKYLFDTDRGVKN
jgi:hypothetical protein